MSSNFHPLLRKIEATYHKTGMLDMDAMYAINKELLGEGEAFCPNPCGELLFRNPLFKEENDG